MRALTREMGSFARRRIVIGFIRTRGTRSARCVYAGGPFRAGDATAVCAKNGGGGGSQVQGHRRLPPPPRPRPPSPPPPPTHPLTYHRNIYTHIGASEPRQERIEPSGSGDRLRIRGRLSRRRDDGSVSGALARSIYLSLSLVVVARENSIRSYVNIVRRNAWICTRCLLDRGKAMLEIVSKSQK